MYKPSAANTELTPSIGHKHKRRRKFSTKINTSGNTLSGNTRSGNTRPVANTEWNPSIGHTATPLIFLTTAACIVRTILQYCCNWVFYIAVEHFCAMLCQILFTNFNLREVERNISGLNFCIVMGWVYLIRLHLCAIQWEMLQCRTVNFDFAYIVIDWMHCNVLVWSHPSWG